MPSRAGRGSKAKYRSENYELIEDDAPHPFDSPERQKHIERIAARPDAHADFKAEAYQLDRGIPGEDQWEGVTVDTVIAKLGEGTIDRKFVENSQLYVYRTDRSTAK